MAHDVAVDAWLPTGTGARRVGRAPRTPAASTAGTTSRSAGSARGCVHQRPRPDGVVEAIEAPDADFCIGVQWHPENFWQTGEFNSLFESFVAAARARLRTD